MKKRKTVRWISGLIVGVGIMGLFLWWQNNGLVVTEYEYILSEEHNSLDGVRIAQISDLHSKIFGGRLEQLLVQARPDVVLLTGDLVDRRDTDFTDAVGVARAAAELAPTYYAPGNHEASLNQMGSYEMLKNELTQVGVRVLENQAEQLEISSETIQLIGLLDPAFYNANLEGAKLVVAAELEQLTDEETLDVVLGHRPILLEAYAAGGADLVFSGHAHGGQVRLPFIGGLFAPDEWFFPEYTNGIHQCNDTTQIISRGLGNSIAPLRIFNRPELVVVTLREG